MEEKNNKIMSKFSNFIDRISDESTKSYVFLTLLAGVLTLLTISSLLSVNTFMSFIIFYAAKIIGVLIYFGILKTKTKPRKIFAIIAIISLITSLFMFFYMNNLHGGLDRIGEAIFVGFIFIACIYIYYISAFILFIIYARNFIFERDMIITIVIIVFMCYFLSRIQ